MTADINLIFSLTSMFILILLGIKEILLSLNVKLIDLSNNFYLLMHQTFSIKLYRLASYV